MPSSRLQQAQAQGRLQRVPMDDVGFLKFSKDGNQYLGTAGLNSCAAVVIVSQKAAILAHIAPRPSAQNIDKATGDAHVKTKLSEVKRLLDQHANEFYGQQAGCVVAYAVYQGKVALESQVQIIGALLTKWQFPTNPIPYYVMDSKEIKDSANGTVLIDATGKVPAVYVEDALAVKSKASGSSVAGPSNIK